MAINLSMGLMSYSISFGVYSVMLALFLIGQRDSPKGKPFVALISVSVIWSGLLVLSQIGASLAFEMIALAELIRSLAWIFVLQYAMGSYRSNREIFNYKNILSPINLVIILLFSCVLLIFNHKITLLLEFENVNFVETILQFFFPILGLVIVEQLYRNTPKVDRWGIQILCLSAASVFVYDVFVYSNALFWNQLNYDYWSARGLVNVLVLPIIILSAVRNPTLAPRIYISRQFIFHSTTLIISGVYLIILSSAAYFIKILGGEWGDLLLATFLFAGFLSLLLVFSSTTLRLHIKNFLYANFFSNKYDYRDEWHRFSNTLLSSSNKSINERALLSVCQIMDSQGAALWLKDNDRYYYTANWNLPLSEDQKHISDEFIDNILPQKKDIYACQTEKSDHYFKQINNAWFVLPLWNMNVLFGFALFQSPLVMRNLDDEDKELLKTVSDHISLFFLQHKTSFQLMEAQKFQHISQMTAFLVHDLKTVLSQLILMTENAKVYKTNPEFIDDMLVTIEHVANKMQRLILQLKEPDREESLSSFDLNKELSSLVNDMSSQNVVVKFTGLVDSIDLHLNKDAFKSAIKHIIQNAIEASAKGSIVYVVVYKEKQRIILKVTDQGCGMSEAFIADHLFRAFDSSKGVTGMGVGVYQSRQFFRSINGELSVTSQINVGSEFTIEIPVEN